VWNTPNTQSSFLLNVAIQRGDGLTPGSTFVPLFTSPNGTASGTNNAVQGFSDPDAVNFKVARYQLMIFSNGLRRAGLSVGQLDLTEDFDDDDDKSAYEHTTSSLDDSSDLRRCTSVKEITLWNTFEAHTSPLGKSVDLLCRTGLLACGRPTVGTFPS